MQLAEATLERNKAAETISSLQVKPLVDLFLFG